jgi:3-oxoacyl-[acyl-carrier-protein] synthase-3
VIDSTAVQSNLLGSGIGIPEHVVTNEDLSRIIDTTDEWIREKTGIRERRIASGKETTAFFAAKAASTALEKADITSEMVDVILVGTVTPEMHIPSTACFVQKAIGAVNAACMDVRSACTGFISALISADALLKTGTFRYSLVIGADTLSKFVDWEDRKTCVLFGDGAGAVMLGRAHHGYDGIIASYLRSDGRMTASLNIPGGGSLYPPSRYTVEHNLHSIKMDGQEVFRYAVTKMAETCNMLLKKSRLTMDEIDLIIPHQANIRILKSLQKILRIPPDKLMVNLERYGNTSAASIAIALHEALETNRLRSGSTVMLVSFGGGFTWGGLLIRT